MSTLMASTTSTPTFSCSSAKRASTIFSSSYVFLYPQTPKSRLSSCTTQLDLGLCSAWNGLRRQGISIIQKPMIGGTKGRCKGKVVYASLFGVGAPEALVIGVVALLVFGPKGLAEVARNLGKTLRAFQPTIRELQEVSREFKSTLEKEIGLDEISTPTQNAYNSTATNVTPSTSSDTNTEKFPATLDQNGSSPTNQPYSSEEYLKITEEQLKASAVTPQEQTALPGDRSEPQSSPQEVAATTTSPPKKLEGET